MFSVNFAFFEPHGVQLFRLAALAELYFPTDANTCLLKLRQFAELLAQDIAARGNLLTTTDESFVDLLHRLSGSRYVPSRALDLFHYLRKIGNAAAHADHDDHGAALSALKVARELGLWFVRAFGHKPDLVLGPFRPPQPPPDPTEGLRKELERLQAELEQHRHEADKELERLLGLLRESQEKASKEAEERATWQSLAEEAEARKHIRYSDAAEPMLPSPLPRLRDLQREEQLPDWLDQTYVQRDWEALEAEADAASKLIADELRGLQSAAQGLSGAGLLSMQQEAAEAAEHISLDEDATRAVIEQQLREWDD